MTTVLLRDRRSGEPVSARLSEVRSAFHAMDFAQWLPYREQAQVDALIGRKVLPPSNHWNWQAKLTKLSGTSNSFSIYVGRWLQGVLTLSEEPQASRLNGSGQKKLLYVSFIETAPWNQPAYVESNPLYGGVGVALIYAAVYQSRNKGCEGALGLHALREAARFYRGLGFQSLGADLDEEELEYFELNAEGAAKLVD